MARVKTSIEASKITLESKWQRYERIKRLFGIRRLGDLFPANATPNGAANDPTLCSGDVLRDLCQIGEALRLKGTSRADRVERVKGNFKNGVVVRHADIRELLAKVKKNEFEAALVKGKVEGVRYVEDGVDQSEGVKGEHMGNLEQIVGVNSIEEADKGNSEMSRRLNRFERNTPTLYDKEEMQQAEEITANSNPGFVTADQIRAEFRRRSDISMMFKRKHPGLSLETEDKSPDNTNGNVIINEAEFIPTKRVKVIHLPDEPHTPYVTKAIPQPTNTAPSKLSHGLKFRNDFDAASPYSAIFASLSTIDDVVSHAQEKLKVEDVQNTAQLLVTTRNLIASALTTYDGA